jgi:hypothetical protein
VAAVVKDQYFNHLFRLVKRLSPRGEGATKFAAELNSTASRGT